jgi:hypothetical protein
MGKAHLLSSGKHVDDDEYPDLIVRFEDIRHLLNGNISHATLKGKLSDGTIILGNGNSFIHSKCVRMKEPKSFIAFFASGTSLAVK